MTRTPPFYKDKLIPRNAREIASKLGRFREATAKTCWRGTTHHQVRGRGTTHHQVRVRESSVASSTSTTTQTTCNDCLKVRRGIGPPHNNPRSILRVTQPNHQYFMPPAPHTHSLNIADQQHCVIPTRLWGWMRQMLTLLQWGICGGSSRYSQGWWQLWNLFQWTRRHLIQ